MLVLGLTGTEPSVGTVTSGFDINASAWLYHKNDPYGDWSVYYDGHSAFYLQYSAVPEPSTYIMVTGLLMVPGMSYLRRIEKKFGGGRIFPFGDHPFLIHSMVDECRNRFQLLQTILRLRIPLGRSIRRNNPNS